MGFSDDDDKDLPDWLSELGPEDKEQPDWDSEDPDSNAALPEEEDTPEWLEGIRSQEGMRGDAASYLGGRSASQEGEDDEDAWLESIREQFQGGQGPEEEEAGDEDEEDFLDKVRALKAEDEQLEEQPPNEEHPLSDDEPTVRLQDYWDSRGEQPPEGAEGAPETTEVPGAESEEEDMDWVSGLPEMDIEPVEDQSSAFVGEQLEAEGEEGTPEWLQGVKERAAQDSAAEQPPADEEPDEEEAPKSNAFTEDPKVTGSLPSWMESLQTSGLVLPQEQDEEEELEGAGYSEEEITTLFEDDDLPDWLGSEGAEGGESVLTGEETAPTEVVPEREIERAELPSWLQAMRPVETVTSVAEEEAEEEAEEQGAAPEKERVGPLSGLSGVLPAEPHIVHFGSPPRSVPGFELTDVQKEYTQLLKQLVAGEQAVDPSSRRSVANPQRILRWIIAVLLLAVTLGTLWLGNSFVLALPDPAGMPPENLALISLVNSLGPEDRVLLAVEYQPGLSGELEAASTALVQHLLLQEAQLVLVSSQPVGPGLGEAFLKEHFSGVEYVNQGEYVNLGYISGGAAGLLGLASNIRQTKADLPWDQPPLNAVQSVRDFSLVLVLTDDPDVARNWIEQVGPALDPGGTGQGVPLAMVVSAQAEPLVYPYYYSSPQQLAGLVSGVSGGAYYETVVGSLEAGRFWTAYNAGLMLAVVIIAVGSIINLARNSLQGFGKGRS